MPTVVRVLPWPDPVLDTSGHDPRSHYVETFWLPSLGPTAVLLLRHLADRFDRTTNGIELPLADTSQALGLGHREGTASPLVRTLTRLAQFELAIDDGQGTIAVRRHLPPISPRHLRRLPPHLQREHAQWERSRDDASAVAESRRRSRRLAALLLEQGDEPDHVERKLSAAGLNPSVCRESVEWAAARLLVHDGAARTG